MENSMRQSFALIAAAVALAPTLAFAAKQNQRRDTAGSEYIMRGERRDHIVPLLTYCTYIGLGRGKDEDSTQLASALLGC